MYKKIHRYLADVTPERIPILQEMERYARKHRFPIIGPLVGRLLYQMALVTKARKVLELGSGYGYSAIWFALAMGPKGEIVLTDGDAENRERALQHFAASRLKTKFDFRVGDALKIARKLPGPYDIVLNDIDKQDYPKTIELAAARLRSGGLFITDNLIWSGKVADAKRDATTERIVEFTEKLYADRRFFTTVLPIRDGVGIAVRI